jgi:hypothetical protein
LPDFGEFEGGLEGGEVVVLLDEGVELLVD